MKTRWLILALLLTGCTSRTLDELPQQLVVEGWICSGEQPVVMITTSIAPSENFQKVSDQADHVIRWARVSISDGNEEVVMMGKADKDYLTEYIYTTGRMLGQAGKTYTLTVEYKDYRAKAVTTIPAPVPLEGLEARREESGRYAVSARFTDPPGKNYYRLFCMVEGQEKSYIPCMLGTLNDSDFSGEITLSVNKSQIISRRQYQSGFEKGERLHVRLCTMDEGSWNYWSDFDRISLLSTSPVFPVRFNISGNMNGALGYWAGYGVSEKSISVE